MIFKRMHTLRNYVKLVLETIDRAPLEATWDEVFGLIRAHRFKGAPMPDIDINKLASMMAIDYDYTVPREVFEPVNYETFDDWFLRRLSPATFAQCVQSASSCDVCSPVEGIIRAEPPPNGKMTLKHSMIDVNLLFHLLDASDLVQIALKKVNYHRVHSPFDGDVIRIRHLSHNELFDGAEAMTIFEYETSFGPAKLICIGEKKVQSFVKRVHAGSRVRKMQEMGHFYFGSQVIVVLPHGLNLDREPRNVFPGDPIGFVQPSAF